jgi:hypothetical protein
MDNLIDYIMKKLIYFIFILVSLTSCFPTKISSDFDRTADFPSYKTYSFIIAPENLPYERTQSEILIGSIAAELESRGFTKSDNPNVYIDVKVIVGKKKTAASSSNGEYSTMYGQNYLYMWSQNFTNTNIKYQTNAKGTMYIDMIDVKKKQLVWQGCGTANMSAERNPQDREKKIAEAVTKIFTQYPPKISTK